MSNLPDELWRRILEIGVENPGLGHKDLCCVSITCARLHRLSADSSLWSVLLARDFPSTSSSSSSTPAAPKTHPSKSLYKTKFERDKARKLGAWRLAVLNVESQIAVCSMNLQNFQSLLSKEQDKLKSAAAELANLENVRRTSVALNVWQPEVIRSSHRKMVEQCTVPVESRVSALQMEIRVCKQQINIHNKAYKDQKLKLDERKEALASLTYHPVHTFQLEKSGDCCNRKRKKLKQSSEYFWQLNKKLDTITSHFPNGHWNRRGTDICLCYSMPCMIVDTPLGLEKTFDLRSALKFVNDNGIVCRILLVAPGSVILMELLVTQPIFLKGVHHPESSHCYSML